MQLLFNIVVEADGSSVVCDILMTLMAALPGFLNKKTNLQRFGHLLCPSSG